MTVRLFRSILGAVIASDVLLLLISILRLTGVMGRGMSDALDEANLSESIAHFDNMFVLGAWLAVWAVLLIAGLVAIVGMALMRQWGRSLSLWITLPSTAMCLSFSALAIPALDYTLVILSCMLWGASLALAYCSPIASEFR